MELFAVLTQLALQQQHFVLQMPLLSPGGQQSQKVSQSTTPNSLSTMPSTYPVIPNKMHGVNLQNFNQIQHFHKLNTTES